MVAVRKGDVDFVKAHDELIGIPKFLERVDYAGLAGVSSCLECEYAPSRPPDPVFVADRCAIREPLSLPLTPKALTILVVQAPLVAHRKVAFPAGQLGLSFEPTSKCGGYLS